MESDLASECDRFDEIDLVVDLGECALTTEEFNETLKLETVCRAADVLAQCFAEGLHFIVVHGAGSFGQVISKQYGVPLGYRSKPKNVHSRVKYGFSVVHQSVTKLNQKVVEILVSRGIPAISCSPCGIWTSDLGHVVRDGCEEVKALLSEGFVPVLHGDCILDNSSGCSMLSSNAIVKVFCSRLKVKKVIFVVDCATLHSAASSLRGDEVSFSHLTDGNGFVSSTQDKASCEVDAAAEIVRLSKGEVQVQICSLDNNSFMNACLSATSHADTAANPS